MISTGDLGKKSSELAVLQLNISVDTDSDYSSRPGGSVLQGYDNSDDHILAYVLIPLGALVLIAVLSFLVSSCTVFSFIEHLIMYVK